VKKKPRHRPKKNMIARPLKLVNKDLIIKDKRHRPRTELPQEPNQL
jgi:hypothetical protein